MQNIDAEISEFNLDARNAMLAPHRWVLSGGIALLGIPIVEIRPKLRDSNMGSLRMSRSHGGPTRCQGLRVCKLLMGWQISTGSGHRAASDRDD